MQAHDPTGHVIEAVARQQGFARQRRQHDDSAIQALPPSACNIALHAVVRDVRDYTRRRQSHAGTLPHQHWGCERVEEHARYAWHHLCSLPCDGLVCRPAVRGSQAVRAQHQALPARVRTRLQNRPIDAHGFGRSPERSRQDVQVGSQVADITHVGAPEGQDQSAAMSVESPPTAVVASDVLRARRQFHFLVAGHAQTYEVPRRRGHHLHPHFLQLCRQAA
jgi:hypothetical protein